MDGGCGIVLKGSAPLAVAHALSVLGFGSYSFDREDRRMELEKPSRKPPAHHVKRHAVVRDQRSQAVIARKTVGPPVLATSKRAIRKVESIVPSKSSETMSTDELVELLSRLAAPRTVKLSTEHTQSDSTRVGFRITVSKRTPHEQEDYMRRLSIPRMVFVEAVIPTNVIQRFLSSSALVSLVERLSQPRSLDTLIERYSVPKEYEEQDDSDFSFVDLPLPLLRKEITGLESPYLPKRPLMDLRQPQIRQSSVEGSDLHDELTFLIDTIYEITRDGESDFPGHVDAFVAPMLESILADFNKWKNVPSALNFPCHSAFEMALSSMRSLKPKRLLLCRLHSVIKLLTNHIIKLQS